MPRRRLAVTALAAAALVASPALSGAAVAAEDGGHARAALHGSAPSWALDHRDTAGEPAVTSSAADGARMDLTLHVPMRNKALADRWIGSGKVVSLAQYRRTFTPSTARMQRAAAWARDHGLRVTGSNRDSGSVYVTGSVGQIDAALHAGIANATVHGRRGLVATKVPSIDTASGVTSVAGLNTLTVARTHDVVNPRTTRSSLTPPRTVTTAASARVHRRVGDGVRRCAAYWGRHLYPSVKKYRFQSNYLCGYRPGQLGRMYAAGPAAVEAPRVAIVLWGNDTRMLRLTRDYMSKVRYRTLPSTKYHTHVARANSRMKDCDPQGTKIEQALDVQAVHAVAPRATIDYYGAASCSFVDLARTVQRVVSAQRAQVISMSWGSTTDAGMTLADVADFDWAFTQAALTGISVFASTGDWGDNSTVNPNGRPGVGFPASSPYVTAVGGTAVGIRKDTSRMVTTGWEDRFYAQKALNRRGWSEFRPWTTTTGAGGGRSRLYRKPTWQRGRVPATVTHRMLPDVSALADPHTPFTIHFSNRDNRPRYTGVGGTSLAAPIVSALVAVAKARNWRPGGTTRLRGRQVGLASPWLYEHMHSKAIRDVRHRSAGVYMPGGPTGHAVVGFDSSPEKLRANAAWDNVTGVGEPHGLAFLKTFGK